VTLVVLLAALGTGAVLWGPSLMERLSVFNTAGPTDLSLDPAMGQMVALRQEENAQLNGYGWVDKEQNLVHIPITQAIALLAEQPLPVGIEPTATAAPEPTPNAEAAPVDLRNVSFKDNVLPIFEQHCSECHGDTDPEEQLQVTTYRTLIVGSQNGPVIEPGDPDNSYLVKMVVSGKMPKKGDKLSQQEIDVITAWIKAGAQDN
jgi:mono/diheme cytochrome c family protein